MTQSDLISKGTKKIYLPQIRRVVLRNFSLYDNRQVVTADFGEGVFCLAGANGLGKSTFLAALNFAITGIVANPDQRFESYSEYYDHSRAYSSTYFRGRISEDDREAAEIELEMQVADRHYKLVRSMFEPTGLRQLSITSLNDSGNVGLGAINNVTINNEERHNAYAEQIVADIGLAGFDQLVFLQHFVLSFDERRKLIFWDEDITQAALFLAFGLGRDVADRADNLRRTAERADSLVRNLQWQATELRSRQRDVEAKASVTDADALAASSEDHRSLLGRQEAAAAQVARLESELRDGQLMLAEVTAERQALKAEFDRLFRQRNRGSISPRAHSVVARSIETDHCTICGAVGTRVSEAINAAIDAGRCPLCDTDLTGLTGDNGDSLEALRELDRQVVVRSAQISEVERACARTADILTIEHLRLREVVADLSRYERANELALMATGGQGTAVRGILEQYRSQIADLTERKDRELKRRNTARGELKVLQRQLAEAFARVEDEFVPRFTMLATDFLGLDLDVSFEMLSSKVRLVLAVESARRRAQDTLSESQRLFIDLALRMALVQQMSPAGYEGGLYVDTPEGSLDIAYESRAGRMFGSFVKAGHQVVMTANINSSQLLLKLAETCGAQKMTLMRMTDWTSLSEVQIAEEGLFDGAYDKIESALVAGG